MGQTLFTDDHEYIQVADSIGTVGVTDYAQNALGDVVYVELPKVGQQLKKGGQAGVVESVKSASEIYAPVTGEVVEVNDALAAEPALVNQDPRAGGWFFKIKIADMSELDGMKDEAAYNNYIKGL